MSRESYNVLIFGASYGSLLATKLIMAGHNATMVCRAATAEQFNAQGSRVLMPIRGRAEPVALRSESFPGTLRAAAPDQIDPAEFDLVALAMQEPQYAAPGVRQLLSRAAEAETPCMSIMNMPPPPYLSRIPSLAGIDLSTCYAAPAIWEGFKPDLMTLASPDPQAFRPPEEDATVLKVTLPTNFKVARFGSDAHTAMLRKIEADIDAVRLDVDGEAIEVPVKLRVSDSLFTPLAKWAMLLTGNYRCVTADGPRAIRDAVHSDEKASKAVYEGVVELCVSLGADRADMVPFEKYAKAAEGLAKPSSAARALYAGATHIERVDALVKAIAHAKDMVMPSVDETVRLVNARLAANAEAASKVA